MLGKQKEKPSSGDGNERKRKREKNPEKVSFISLVLSSCSYELFLKKLSEGTRQKLLCVKGGNWIELEMDSKNKQDYKQIPRIQPHQKSFTHLQTSVLIFCGFQKR